MLEDNVVHFDIAPAVRLSLIKASEGSKRDSVTIMPRNQSILDGPQIFKYKYKYKYQTCYKYSTYVYVNLIRYLTRHHHHHHHQWLVGQWIVGVIRFHKRSDSEEERYA